MLPDNFMGAEIAQDDIGWDNMMEVQVARALRDIQEQYLIEKESHRTVIAWSAGVVVGMM